FEVRAHDCIVHLALENAHTLQAGPPRAGGLLFGQRTKEGGNTRPPPAGGAWAGETGGPGGAEDGHPWAAGAAARPPEIAELSPRPSNIVNVVDVEPYERVLTTIGRRWRTLSAAAGSEQTGLGHCEVLPGMLNVPPHCHTLEEE